MRQKIIINGVEYLAEYITPIDENEAIEEYPLKDSGKWVLYKFTYHKSTFLRSINRKRSKQIPRLKKLGVFDSLDDCKAHLKLI